MMDLEFLLEDGDLLDQVELNLIEEASFYIDKKRLHDEDYIKDLTKDLKTPGKQIKLTTANILAMIAFTMVPLNANPASLALCALVNTAVYSFAMGGLTSDSQKESSKTKIANSITKLISKLEREQNSISDKSEKAKIEKEIKKLKHNRDLIEKA